jgi:hypothetical protein
MSIELFPLDLDDQGGFFVPRDEKLRDLAADYCARELKERPILQNYRKVWLVCEVDAELKPVKAVGIVGYALKVDISLIRVSEAKVAKKAYMKIRQRLNSYFADNGARGQEVLVYVDGDAPEHELCPLWKETLEAYGSKPAHRHIFEVK